MPEKLQSADISQIPDLHSQCIHVTSDQGSVDFFPSQECTINESCIIEGSVSILMTTNRNNAHFDK